MSANLKETLNTYSLSELKKMVSAYNKKVKIGPYTKMKKSELINLMTSDKHRAEFSSVKPKSKAKAEEPKKKIPFKKTGRSGAEVMAEKKAEPKKAEPKKAEKKAEPKKAEPKKAEPKKAEAPKKKPPFMKLKEDIDELKGIIKKSYEKNKEKLSKMTPKKYEDTIEKKLDTFIEDAREIYEDYNFSMSKTNMDDLEKYFFSVVPKKAEKKAEPKK